MNALIHITNEKTKTTYTRGKLLGKGGFATCYEFIEGGNKLLFAAKCITKESTKQKNQGAKIRDEIEIHRYLVHNHIVKMHQYFDDKLNIYILLELCENKSLSELHKRRKHITEPETRYLSRHIALACEYIHERKIIHRDLKLANILLDVNMNAKVADFGLAGRVNEKGDKKMTTCGTPNYIAPEILRKEGHSYEVDVWSLGCIIYTLLVGSPPFETDHMKTTYAKIKRNDYSIPMKLSKSTAEIIMRSLDNNAHNRPTMKEMLKMQFFKEFIPESLPKSSLSTEPRFANILLDKTNNSVDDIAEPNLILDGNKDLRLLNSLKMQLIELLSTNRIFDDTDDLFKLLENSEDPKLAPIYWIAKWVDYTDRYGLGYKLSNECTGIVFNDNAKMIHIEHNDAYQYIDADGKEKVLTPNTKYLSGIMKKLQLMDYFKNYMNQNLTTTGEKMIKDGIKDAIGMLPYVVKFKRTNVSIALFLSNGTFQVNFIRDHIKIILCPIMGAVTYIDKNANYTTFSMKQLQLNGYTKDLQARLKFALTECREFMRTL